jgi:hypothetical protein
MARRIGDLYRVSVNDREVAYFQHIADDKTQLGSNVICVFARRYSKDDPPSDLEIVNDSPHFYAHVAIPVGEKHCCWVKVGYAEPHPTPDLLFRGTNDHGHNTKVSKNWHIWKIGEPMKRVGALTGDRRKAEIGMVINPYSILCRIRTGSYDFAYPG